MMSKRMNDDFESPRLDRAAYVFSVQKCNSISMDSTELPSSSKRVCDGYEETTGTHEKFDQSTGEVLFAVGCREVIDEARTKNAKVHFTSPHGHLTFEECRIGDKAPKIKVELHSEVIL